MSESGKTGVLIACGGTGGHFFPGVAVGEELVRRGHEVIFVISEKKIDTLASEPYPQFRFERIPSVAMPKPWSPRMVPFLSRFFQGVGLCRKWIREIDAKAVLGMGGFTSTAPLVASRLSGCAGFIHESNAIPGRANRLNAHFANRALVGWEACRDHFPAGKTEVTGTPVRPALLECGVGKEEARRRFDLAPDRFTVLVMGGSQGAQGINEAVTGSLDYLDGDQVQFLHLCGPGNEEAVEGHYRRTGVRAFVAPFYAEVELAYRAADVAICRSGASSLTEMSVMGLPGILVPYPYAADDHQTRNAEVFVESSASLLRPQSTLEPLDLAKTVADLAADSRRLTAMGEGMKALAPLSAAQTICDLIERETR